MLKTIMTFLSILFAEAVLILMAIAISLFRREGISSAFYLLFFLIAAIATGLRVRKANRRLWVAATICHAIAAIVYVAMQLSWGPPASSFDGPSSELKKTVIVSTLDVPLADGKNVVWCASFTQAWKSLIADCVHEPIQLIPESDIAERLNNAMDPTQYLSDELYYSKAGKIEDGVVESIHQEMKAKFPDVRVPDFTADASLKPIVAYSYLEASLAFPMPYIQSTEPLLFTSGDASQTPISAFGLRKCDSDKYFELRKQARAIVIPKPVSQQETPEEAHFKTMHPDFAIDLHKDSAPHQLILASIPKPASLAEGIAAVQNAESLCQQSSTPGADMAPHFHDISSRDILLVPDISFNIVHHFSELENAPFHNQALEEYGIAEAVQGIAFQLDRGGVRLKSFGSLQVQLCLPYEFVFDKPFLVYMKLRAAPHPYFAMWVDNAELLNQR